VNEGTGAIRLAGLFPNPGNILRPGGYARVRAVIRLQDKSQAKQMGKLSYVTTTIARKSAFGYN